MEIMFLILMFYAHFVDDYVLQGCLANLKQKAWWNGKTPQDVNPALYKYDYLMGLFCHALMWSISIMIPTMFAGVFIWWLVPINFIIHFIVDDLKANRHKINLVIDQSIHFVQIILTFCLCFIWL